MKRRELRARVVFAREAVEAGDTPTALAVLHDLETELGMTPRPATSCRFCGLRDWAGVIERHERVIHAHELLDLEERAA